jgi:hypothetical protein
MTNPTGFFGAVTFSAMAIRSHQLGQKGISAHRLAAPWSERRDLCVRYMAQGGFDFIGLKHVHLDPGKPDCALSYFLDGLNAADARYGTLNAVVRPTPDAPARGDTLSILYRKDIWTLEANRSGPVWTTTPVPANEPGGGGNVFNFAALQRRIAADGIRPERLHVYNIRLRDKDSPALDIYRALCLGEIIEHMTANAEAGVPAILLCDTNCKTVGSLTDRLLLGRDGRLPGLTVQPQQQLQDSYLKIHPDAHGKVRTQHNFVSPGDISGSERNNRVLYMGGLDVGAATISTWSGEGGRWPSYHYPVEAWFRRASAT